MTDSGRWTDEFLESMRTAGDPSADAAIAEAFELGQVGRVNELLAEFHKNSDAVPADLPPRLKNFFQDMSALPDWADQARMERGNDLFGRYAGHMLTILHCYSLPACFAAAKGVEVLYRTKRLQHQVSRRILETGQFLIDVLDEGGLGPHGRGRRSAQKVRLLHATIRHFLRHRTDWDMNLGLPINQEDLAATVCSFSVMVPRGLATLGVDLPTQDRDDFFHIWNVIGHLMGVDERLMPRDFDDGEAMTDKIMRRHWAPSEAGRVITKALLDYMQNMLPGPALDGAPPTLIRYLAGDNVADILAVPPADWTNLALQLQSGVSLGYGKIGDTSAIAAKLSSQLGSIFLKASVGMSNWGNRYDWTIPESESAHANAHH
jgi:hypothetical protein